MIGLPSYIAVVVTLPLELASTVVLPDLEARGGLMRSMVMLSLVPDLSIEAVSDMSDSPLGEQNN